MLLESEDEEEEMSQLVMTVLNISKGIKKKQNEVK